VHRSAGVLEQDPGETVDLSSRQPAVVDSLLATARAADSGQLHLGDRATVLTFPDEVRARDALSAAVSSGATVVSLTPHRRTLEELFVSRARGKAATS